MKWLILCMLINSTAAVGQTVSTFLPKPISKSERYLFYLHGGVVTGRGDMVVNESAPEWGPYEYRNILDTLRKRGFNIISEVRQRDIPELEYANKIAKQIDSLLKANVSSKNIIVLGASAGWDIALHVSSKLKNPSINFVIMGGCWPNTYKDYFNIELYGRFLSIIETTDPHGTCYKIFEGRKQLTSYKEIKLNTGLSHGFIYKGHKEWVDPIVKWFHEK